MVVTDSDSGDFDGGTFSITSSGHTTADDNDDEIGTTSGGTGATPLSISLNAQASLAAVNALARSIAFTIDSDTPDDITRSLSYTIEDGDGGTSESVFIKIDVVPVNDEPQGTDNTITTNEDIPVIIRSTDFGFFDTTAESNSFAAVTITTPPSNGTLTLNNTVSTLSTSTTTNLSLRQHLMAMVPVIPTLNFRYMTMAESLMAASIRISLPIQSPLTWTASMMHLPALTTHSLPMKTLLSQSGLPTLDSLTV